MAAGCDWESGSVYKHSRFQIAPGSFNDYSGQCVGGRIRQKDEVEALRVLAGNRNRASQVDESPTDTARAKGIRKVAEM